MKLDTICIVSKWFPVVGGVVNRLWREVGVLTSAGVNVHVVTNARTADSFDTYNRELYARFGAHEEDVALASPNLHVHEVSNSPPAAHTPQTDRSHTKLLGALLDVIADTQPDLLLAAYFEPYGFVAEQAAHLTGIPFAIRNAGSDLGRLAVTDGAQPAYRGLIANTPAFMTAGSGKDILVDRYGVPSSSCVAQPRYALDPMHFNSRDATLDWRTLFNDARLLGCGEVPDALDPKLPVALMYGSLASGKNSSTLVRALSVLKSKGVNYNAVIVGGGPGAQEEWRALRKQAEQQAVDDRLALLPAAPAWVIPQLLRAATVGVCIPSTFSIPIHTSGIPAEMLACGLPCVASTSAASFVAEVLLPNSLSDTNLTCLEDPTDAFELAEHILKASRIRKEPRDYWWASVAWWGASSIEVLQRYSEVHAISARKSTSRAATSIGAQGAEIYTDCSSFDVRNIDQQAQVVAVESLFNSGWMPVETPLGRASRQTKLTASSVLVLSPDFDMIEVRRELACQLHGEYPQSVIIGDVGPGDKHLAIFAAATGFPAVALGNQARLQLMNAELPIERGELNITDDCLFWLLSAQVISILS